ncbi:hypothetical protein BJY52DRAFT_1221854 [Lactarius psammicola]|nr:hypothetical protein BJY52DRAFT_1221854 [Lactarius psammicola]
MLPLSSSARISESDSFRKLRRLAPALAEIKTESFVTLLAGQPKDRIRYEYECPVLHSDAAHPMGQSPPSYREGDKPPTSWPWPGGMTTVPCTRRGEAPSLIENMTDVPVPGDEIRDGNERATSQNELFRPARSTASRSVTSWFFGLVIASATRDTCPAPAPRDPRPLAPREDRTAPRQDAEKGFQAPCCSRASDPSTTWEGVGALKAQSIGRRSPKRNGTVINQQEQDIPDWSGPVSFVTYPVRLPLGTLEVIRGIKAWQGSAAKMAKRNNQPDRPRGLSKSTQGP